MRNAKRAFPDDRKQALLQSIGLRLYTVNQDTPNIIAVDPAALKDVARRCVAAFARIGRRKDLVPFAADRLEALAPAQGGIFGNHLRECGNVHRVSLLYPESAASVIGLKC
jgi:hypothetical protein